ncbi:MULTISPECIES: uroporphyrinogen-III C-methyltransferase [Vibrio]|uniref:Heme biosynthesis operon protein HemX n=3 Tax=Vibrio TaxID=662 RepID=A0ABX5DCM6_9VIBR|nr:MULTISPECIES: uroporphyrinogen-III C-methyltransferase [Vibrio]MCF4176738.1 uroporphyrinogen-III C-methyltransferase [Vibrio sp. McD22-P3]PCD87448.1 heme biosynthesis operon protein HemX [Vibrio mediterranei]PRQ67452.1 heme biosynthesis operon protein HemX [Vibrio mediterranei]SBO12903.1 Putative uroporphyrinogen-III C-methyltransferase [Vibrio mediterranei]
MTNKNKDEQIQSEEQQDVKALAPEADTSKAEQETSQHEQAKPPTTAPEFEEKQGKRGVKLGAVAIVLAVIFGGGLSYQMQKQASDYEARIAKLESQLQATTSNLSNEMQQVQSDTLKQAKTVTHKAEVVLGQQQKSIESLQLAVADVKGRRPNDWLLAEADYLVKLAGRKLFLEHDVVSATRLMESADQRIAALNDPSLVSLRQSMANDITKLRTVPLIDRDGLVLRLTSLQQEVDKLPLANAILPDAPAVEKRQVSQDIYDWQDNLMTSLKDFSENFITFRTRDGNVIPLLSPEQHFYLKENIKSKIETAIRAVYKEQGEIYKVSLETAEKWSESFFDMDNNSVKEFNAALGKLSQQNIQVNYPVKLETQAQLSDVINERLRREVTTIITEEK